MNYLYLLINAGAVSIPLLFSFHPRIRFYRKWNALFPALAAALLVFIPWDIHFTRLCVWGFNSEYLCGIYLWNLPLEEVLFFICIPYACLFTYHCFGLMELSTRPKIALTVSAALVVALVAIAVIYHDRRYTFVTTSSLAVLISSLQRVFRATWLYRFYFTYLIILIPFFIVNGLLTGTGLEKPIVWYDDEQNSGVRLLTIPFEDIFYGMLLLMFATAVYERLLRHSLKKSVEDKH